MANKENVGGWVPYQSCALFGALRFFANIRNVVCLIYGPAGCVHFHMPGVMNLNGFMDAEYPVDLPKIYCTDFNEHDVVFGGSDRLIRSIEVIMKNDKPDAVFIFCCCASEIIGEDLEGAVSAMNMKYNGCLHFLHVSGVAGNHKDGMRMAGQLFYDAFLHNRAVQKDNSVNLLGDLDRFSRSSRELQSYLTKAGASSVRMIPGAHTIAELEKACNARMNVVVCGNAAMYLAKKMTQEYGTPIVGQNADFYGIEHSRETYCKVFSLFASDPASVYEGYESAKKQLTTYTDRIRGRSVAVVAGTRRALGYAAVLKELGLDVKLVFSECNADIVNPTSFQEYAQQVFCNIHPDDLPDLLASLHVEFVFSTLPELVAPIPYVERLLEDFTGFTGAVRMAEYICHLLETKP